MLTKCVVVERQYHWWGLEPAFGTAFTSATSVFLVGVYLIVLGRDAC